MTSGVQSRTARAHAAAEPRLARLAGFSGEPEPTLADELARRGRRLAPAERAALAECVRVAERSANAFSAGSPIAALADLAVEASHEAGARGERLSRTLAARTLSLLRDLGLYVDPYGVEPVWPHAGMLILNPFLGCSFGCVYCFRAEEQNERSDWFLDGAPIRVHDDAEVLRRLELHPLHVRGSTRVGLHTATTEPFLPRVKASTFRLLEEIDARGLAREVMVITKFFLTRDDVRRLSSLTGVRVLLLLTYNAAPRQMEAMGARAGMRRRRLATLDHLEEHGERLLWAHYYRPIVTGWNDGDGQIRDALGFGERTGVSVIGGLRPIAGQDEYASARGLPAVAAPAVSGEKVLPDELVNRIVATHASMGLTSTLVSDQSCGLTLLLSRARGAAVPNIEALRMYDAAQPQRPPGCFGRCPSEQMAACAAPPLPTPARVRKALAALAIAAEFRVDARGVHLRARGPRPSHEQMEALVAQLAYAVFVDSSPDGGDSA